MTSRYSDDPAPLWNTLGPVEQAREGEEFKPGTFEHVLAYASEQAQYKRAIEETSARHERRLDYLAVMLQLSSLIFGLAAVIVFSLTAVYFLKHNAASEGARIFGFGTGSVVAAFLGVNAAPLLKRINSRRRPISGSSDSRR